ncbi:MAG: hypothetical protein JXA99_11105 [Candidatus Lokiarchaeota archaeon]|nr:hypothetical protein [Candidatus Lokiarchaeota archaeon]
MKKGVREFESNINRIAINDKNETGAQYYESDYGGSKTQYIELIKSIINNNRNRSIPPYSVIIPVVFNGSTDLTATFLGEQIEKEAAQILTKQLELCKGTKDFKDDQNAFENFLNLLVEFRKNKNAPEHLDKIHKYLNELERIIESSPGIDMKISNIRTEISHLPLIDEERLLKIVFDIIEFVSKYKIAFLFMYDECDDWLSKLEDESIWSKNFLKRQYFFRKLLDRLSNFRLYQIFCLTPRVYNSIRSDQSDRAPGIQRISSEMMKVSSSGPYVHIREQGVYQDDEAEEAMLKWLIILEKAYKKADDEIFNTFLLTLKNKIDKKLSRRKANQAIISSIRSFINLTDEIKHGQNEYNTAEKHRSHYLTIGKIIEPIFASYLNFLNFHFIKKHVDVGEGKLIDGKFMAVKGGKIELYAEIKSFSNPESFDLGKSKQVINCVKNKNSKVIFFLFCKDLTEEYVSECIHKWKNFGYIDPDIDIQLIIPIIINDQTLLNCLVGLGKINYSQLNEKFEDFDKLLRLMNKDFHGKLTNLFPTEEEIPTEEETQTIIKSSEEPIKPTISFPNESYLNLLTELKSINETSKRTAIEIIICLGNKNKVYSYRTINAIKNLIKQPLLKNSFDEALEYLKQHNIIKEKNERVEFNWDYFDKSDIKNNPESLMIQVFKELINIIKEEPE